MQYDTTSLREELVKLCVFHLRHTEDLAKTEPAVLDAVFEELREALSVAMQDMDDDLLFDKPLGWKVKDRRSRTLFTEFGKVTYARRIYIDEFEMRRTPLDEILDIRKGRRLSTNAFSVVSRFASDIPYARSAELFCRHAHDLLSANAVMDTLRELGNLLKERDEERRFHLFDEGVVPEAREEAEVICAEADGIWIHLQKESARNVEIKAFCAYAGKEGGKRKGVVHHACVGAPSIFSEQAVAKLASKYALDKLGTVHLGTDGGAWCKTLSDYIKGPKVVHHLDPWHVNRLIEEAFPLKTTRDRVFGYLHIGDVSGLIEYLKEKSQQHTKTQDKVRKLLTYVRHNKGSIAKDGPSLGTMEGTNAHIYAARMKAWGGGWSRKGASDMARVRSTIASGEELPMPKTRIIFTKQEQRRRDAIRSARETKMSYTIVEADGKGYEPMRVKVSHLGRSVQYVANVDGWMN
jgi:hypothetical protein